MASSFPFLFRKQEKRFPFYNQSHKTRSIPTILNRIICGRLWGSFAVDFGDHLRSRDHLRYCQHLVNFMDAWQIRMIDLHNRDCISCGYKHLFLQEVSRRLIRFLLVKRTLGWKNIAPENFLEINRFFALTSYCNTIDQSNNAFSILGFSLAGKRSDRVFFAFFFFHLFIHWLIKQITITYRNHFSRSYENRSIKGYCNWKHAYLSWPAKAYVL